MNEKRRRNFKVYRKFRNVHGGAVSCEVARGLLYDEGNVQVLWCVEHGYCALQYDSIAQVFGIVKGANIIEIVDDYDAEREMRDEVGHETTEKDHSYNYLEHLEGRRSAKDKFPI